MIDLEKLGVPERVIKALDPARFYETPAIEAAKAWRSTEAGLLVLAGTVGCGKSVAAGWLLAHNVRVETVRVDGAPVDLTSTRSGRWISAAALVEASDFDREFWTPFRKAALLVVDEAGAERLDGKGRATANFAELLRRRYDDGKRTVVTTNLAPSEWSATYANADGGRLRDRLAEAEAEFGRSPIVGLTGPSLRRGGLAA